MNKLYRWSSALIIDDNPTDCLLCEKLVKTAYLAEETTIVNSTSKAMEFLIQEKNQKGVLPNIIFLDLLMPVENGLAFLRYFECTFTKAEVSDTHIVLLTGAKGGTELTAVKQNPLIYKIIHKPYDLEHIEALK